MQWLINMIKEIIHGQLGFFDRGDPGVPDFVLGDLTADGNWHDLDLGPIIPSGARGVLLRVAFEASAYGKQLAFRKKGHTGWPNVAYFNNIVINFATSEDKTVALDSNRFIQYRLSAVAVTVVQITVAAWWLR